VPQDVEPVGYMPVGTPWWLKVMRSDWRGNESPLDGARVFEGKLNRFQQMPDTLEKNLNVICGRRKLEADFLRYLGPKTQYKYGVLWVVAPCANVSNTWLPSEGLQKIVTSRLK
jgi:hypothetical protein